MLLSIDIGNTQTALGLFDEKGTTVATWHMPTDHSFTSDEIQVRLLGYFYMKGLDISCVSSMALAGVVPQIRREWRQVIKQFVGDNYIIVGEKTQPVIKADVPDITQVGSDRLANAVAAETFYGAPAIVVDFGTATNIDVVRADGAYIGGAIAPGIKISFDALTQRAAKLSSIPLEAPQAAIGVDTCQALQSGTVMGAAAMAEGLVTRIKTELNAINREFLQLDPADPVPTPKILATGGLAPLVAQCTDVFDTIDGQLTLKGICEIYRRMHA